MRGRLCWRSTGGGPGVVWRRWPAIRSRLRYHRPVRRGPAEQPDGSRHPTTTGNVSGPAETVLFADSTVGPPVRPAPGQPETMTETTDPARLETLPPTAAAGSTRRTPLGSRYVLEY